MQPRRKRRFKIRFKKGYELANEGRPLVNKANVGVHGSRMGCTETVDGRAVCAGNTWTTHNYIIVQGFWIKTSMLSISSSLDRSSSTFTSKMHRDNQ